MPEEPTPEETTPDTGDTPNPGIEAELAKWKAMARKHEATAKANADAAQKLAALEEKDKTEQEKLAARVAEAESRTAAAEAQALRYQVASAKSLPPDLVEFLTGDTQEDLEAQADKLLTYTTHDEAEDDSPPPHRPKENLRPGRKGTEPSVNTDPLLASLKAKVGG